MTNSQIILPPWRIKIKEELTMGISLRNGKLIVKLNYNGVDYQEVFDTREEFDSITKD